MTDFTIRRAQTGDGAALARCIDAAYAIYASRVKDLPAVSDGISDDIDTHIVWVAERGSAIVGGLVLVADEGNDFAQLANVAVDPRCAGMGLGRQLMQLAESHCRMIGKRELRLSTHVDIPENVQLYEHLGWRETARAGNKVHMVKSL
jgi:ribosomal protein S18 acetylase RimI-like enzyme